MLSADATNTCAEAAKIQLKQWQDQLSAEERERAVAFIPNSPSARMNWKKREERHKAAKVFRFPLTPFLSLLTNQIKQRLAALETFSDTFERKAESLVKERQDCELGGIGGSHGGIAMTQRLEWYNAMVMAISPLDMKQGFLRIGISRMVDLFGNPQNKDWKYLKSYSPFHNVHPEEPYQKALILAKTDDLVVHPAHGRKMTARLEERL